MIRQRKRKIQQNLFSENHESIIPILPYSYSIFIVRISSLSFLSSIYAFYRGYYDLSLVPFSIGCSSVLYWMYPDYSWRRYFDIFVVQIGLWYQCYRIWNSEYWFYYYFVTFISIVWFLLGLLSYYECRSYRITTFTHCMLHVFANIANCVVYSGYIH
jgi:hypothetical protein